MHIYIYIYIYMCVCMCVCMCMCVYLSVSVCLSVCRNASQNQKFFKRNYIKIISNISVYILPIRLSNIAGDLAGARVRVSGWSVTSDSKYKFPIILHFNLKKLHISE